MKRIIFALAMLAASPVFAADNYQATEGSGKIFSCKDVAGVCYPRWIPVDNTGALFGVTANPFFVVFPSAQAVTATLAAETTKVIGTVNQGTSPWVVNETQINGVAYLVGNGATGTGSPRVTIANDNTIPTGWPTAANQTAAKTLGAGTANIGNVGGTSNVTPTDCSGTITSGGAAQNVFSAQSTLRGMTIVNLSTDPMWISFTGTAAIGAAGSYLLAAGSTTVQGGSFTTPLGFGFNTAPSLIAATTADKFSCTRW